MAAGGIVNTDAVVIQKLTGGTVQLDLRFFVGHHRIHQRRLRCGQLALILQYQRGGRCAELILFLLLVKRLPPQLHRGSSRIHTGAVLLDGELRVADFDGDLILNLLKT